MDCGLLLRFIICVCLLGFTAAKCHPEKCGSMSVSYPFWINKSDCGYPGFQIICTEDLQSRMLTPYFKAFLGNYSDEYLKAHYYKIMEIDYAGYLVINSTSIIAQSCTTYGSESKKLDLPNDGPFTISKSNKFVVVGCHTFGTYTYGKWGDARCVSTCESQDPPYCGNGCCEITLPDNWMWINFTGGGLFGLLNSTTNQYDDTCGFSTILDPSTFRVVDNKTSLFWGEGRKADYGLRLNWGVSLQNCSMAKGTSNYSCSINAECIDSPSEKGHVCKCLPGYDGGGYSNGTDCTDIDECSPKGSNMCVKVEEGGICHNLGGSYGCSCAKGYKGDGFHNGTRCVSKNPKDLKPAIIGSVSSFVGVSLIACGLFWCLSVRRLKQSRDKNFRQNGGIELQERIASMGGKRSLKMFSERELEIASNNYSIELGKGGFATVYKGVLVDGTSIAIKKPKSISNDEFNNEIVILSHISHRNVVKLLGCCMESQFPLLVYEFVPNGTVYQHLHSPNKQLTWEIRRQIAMETAEAIAYVHLQASQPIFHRDIKSANILLDDTFTPKVADFGISRLRPSEEMHLSTMAVGTRGYVDPEFVRSNQFTDKSDVFSFGVVLVELLTGLMPLLREEGSVCTLYDRFLSKINDNRLTEILDPTIINKENQGQMENMARLAKECLQVKAKARPSMREVVEELVWIRAATKKQLGLYRDASLVEHMSDVKQGKLNYQSLPSTSYSSYEDRVEDYYSTSPPSTAISSEGPTTALIQIEMSNKYAR